MASTNRVESTNEMKTVVTDADVAEFIEAVPHPVRRQDARVLVELMTRVTGEQPRMWGPSIIGFGSYHYRYATGREGDMAAAGFSPRKAAMTVYVDGLDQYGDLLAALGPHTTGQVCLYIKRLADIDLEILEKIVARSYAAVLARD
jgi:hypothetical protein